MTTASASDDYWQNPSVNFERYYDQSADVPTVYSGGWYDSYTGATCDNFVGLADRKDSDHYLLMGPWTHLARLPGGHDHSENLLFPPLTWGAPDRRRPGVRGRRDDELPRDPQAVLRPVRPGRGFVGPPRVQYFLMGTGDGHQTEEGNLFHGGEWRSAEEWPPEGTEMTKFYAHDDGTLSTEKPAASESYTSYQYDPEDPVPTIGGNTSSYLTYEPRESPSRRTRWATGT